MATITASINDAMGNPTGTAPYLYSFNGASFTENNELVIPYTNVDQTITISVRDGANCTDDTSIVVPAAPKVLATLTEIQSMNCRDDAIIEITGAFGSGSYEIVELPSGNLINGTGTGQITIPSGNPGNYVYRLTDTVTGCEENLNYEILPYDSLEALLIKNRDVSCLGGNDGIITLEMLGYNGDFEYTLYDGIGTTLQNNTENTSTGDLIFGNLTAGSYYIEINALDNPFCSETTATVTVQSPVLALETEAELVTTLSCVPGNDAEIVASATGGWSGYEYQLTDSNTGDIVVPFSNDDVFSGLDAGSYMVTVRDINGCTADITAPIVVDPIPPITITGNPVEIPITCIGAADGSISVTAMGGQGAAFYSYILNNQTTGVSSVPQASNTFTNLVPGTYTITVQDNKGCSDESTSVVLEDPFEVVIAGEITAEPTCLLDGTIALSATGGSGNYEFQYFTIDNNGNRDAGSAWTTDTNYTLASGTYEFVARDQNFGCESPLSIIRTLRTVEPLSVTVDAAAAIINCNGDTDAVLSAEAFGGIGAYQYELQDDAGNVIVAQQDSGTFSDLGAGVYRVAVYSAPDCTVLSDPQTITEPDPLVASISDLVNVGCFGDATGSVDIGVTGGTAPYTYIFSTEPSKALDTNTFSNLIAGDYYVIVQDAAGCDVQLDLTITEPSAPLTLAITEVNDEICFGDATGNFTVAITGGTAPYYYNTTSPNGPFAPVGSDQLFLDNLNGGMSHVVFITDENGCSANIVQEIAVGVDLSSTIETTYECRNGVPHASVTIQLLDESVRNDCIFMLDTDDINQATTNFVFDDLTPGEHYINILHEDGCMVSTGTFTIDQPNPVVVNIIPGEVNEIRFTVDGGTGEYTYYINDRVIDETSYFVVESGMYDVRAIDTEGCEMTVSVEMEFIDVFIPGFFSPNGDGVNDLWEVRNASGYKNMSIVIFDRFGRKLHEFVGSGNWDGRYSGADIPAGDYWYVLKLNHPEDDREFMGNFTAYR